MNRTGHLKLGDSIDAVNWSDTLAIVLKAATARCRIIMGGTVDVRELAILAGVEEEKRRT